MPSRARQIASAGPIFSNRNRLINSGIDIDQRNVGASQTITAGAALAYTVDRWYAYCTGANVTGQRVSNSGNADSRSMYAYRFTGAASVTGIGFAQRIEALYSYDLAGTTSTLSVNLSNSLLTTVTWTAYYANTADTFGTLASPTKTQIATGTFTVTSTSSRYTTQIDIPSAATTGIEIVFSVGAQTSGTWTIGNVQLEDSPVATPFERRFITQEIQLCQRYFAKSYSLNVVPGTGSNSPGIIRLEGIVASSYMGRSTPLPVIMRTAPTVTYYSPSAGTAGRIDVWPSSQTSTTSFGSGLGGISDNSVGAQVINVSSTALYFHYTASAEL